MATGIECTLAKLMNREGYLLDNVRECTGVPHLTLTKLYHNSVRRIRLDNIVSLCNLFKCDLGDLFVLVPAEEKEQKKEPLNKSGAAVGIQCNLSKLMNRDGYTFSHVSISLDISRPTLLQLINNYSKQLNLDNVFKLCNFFKCDIEDLLVLVPAAE
jgi:putative transcriptional regulator